MNKSIRELWVRRLLEGLYPMVDAIGHIEFCRSTPWVLDMHLQATNPTPMGPPSVSFTWIVRRNDIKKAVDLVDGILNQIRIP